MNKDNLLFAILGVLFGFVAGFLLQEVMAARQPPRRSPGDLSVPAGSPPGSADAAGAAGPGPADAANAPAPGGAPGAGGPGGQPPMAEILQLRTYVQQHPDDADAVLKLANLNYDIQNWTRARDLYTHYLELRPDQPDTMTDLGITLRQLGQFDRALDLFRRAQKVDSNHWQSRYNEVIVLAFDLKRLDAAEGVLADLKRLQPANPDVARLAAEVDRRKKAAA